MKIALVIMWGIAGIIDLRSKQISKISYACVWGLLMFYLILNAIGA